MMTVFYRITVSRLVFAALVLSSVLATSVTAQEVAPFNDDEELQALSVDKLMGMEPITKMRTNIYHSVPTQPEDRFAKIDKGPFQERTLAGTAIFWDAPNICYHPLYYEDIGLERYSQNTGWFQPALSTAHFFGRTITLPLHVAVKRPFSCEFPLGHYRPGNCNPYLHYSFPW